MNRHNFLAFTWLTFFAFSAQAQEASLESCVYRSEGQVDLCAVSQQCSDMLIQDIRQDELPKFNPYFYSNVLPESTDKLNQSNWSKTLESWYLSMCDAFDFCYQETFFECDIECKQKKVNYHYRIAMAYGFSEENIYKAIEELEKANAYIDEIPLQQHNVSIQNKQLALAAFQLRLGELRNCMNNHNVDSCIFPLSGNAIHQETKGVDAAIATLNQYIERYGANEKTDWMLNVAYQAIGKEAESVLGPKAIPLSQLKDESGLSRFYDIAGTLGLQAMSQEAGGSAVADFNGDGYLDMAFGSLGPCDPILLFYSDGQGGFIESNELAGLTDFKENMVIVPADYDNDGDVDIYLGSGGWSINRPNYLLQNDGKGIFSDVTKKSGISSLENHNIGISWVDYNLDGWLDLLVCNEFAKPQFFENANGYFQEKDIGIKGNEARCKSIAWGDYNNDGFPDAFLSYHGNQNFLYENIQGKYFKESTVIGKNQTPKFSFVSWFFDYDNDGWLDLFVANFESMHGVQFAQSFRGEPFKGATMRLLRNLEGKEFVDVTSEVGLDIPLTTMGINYGDINNDGYPDIYFGTGGPQFHMLEPNRLFINQQGKKFIEGTYSAHVGNLQKGHGISFADMNKDGYQDIVAQFGGAFPSDKFYPSLYLNPANLEKHWINIRLAGVKANKSGFGARVAVTVDMGNGELTIIHRLVDLGGTFGSNPIEAHIGLGDAESIKKIVIWWPSETAQIEYTNIPLDSYIVLHEESSKVEVLEFDQLNWKISKEGEGHAHKHH